MREIGGYIELDRYTSPMLHEGGIALNCGRNCLAYLIRARGIRKLLLPYLLCGSVRDTCRKEGAEVRLYHIGADFLPPDIPLQENEWLYIVNYYGQLSNTRIEEMSRRYKRVIVDNAQAYFQMPVKGVDTLYTCRKFFGVADGAFLYTDAVLDGELPQDESYERMHFLFGRFERGASEFYPEYVDNNRLFVGEPVKRMSRLTENLLRGIDYETVKKRRTENFECLHSVFRKVNSLELSVPEGAFMYPLLAGNGSAVRERLLRQKIYVPVLWPNVLEECSRSTLEYDLASNILPLPIDQRYGRHDMEYIAEVVKRCID